MEKCLLSLGGSPALGLMKLNRDRLLGMSHIGDSLFNSNFGMMKLKDVSGCA